MEKLGLALEVPSPAAPEALEVTIPAHMTPLHLQLGASRGCISAKLKVVQSGHQPHMLPSVHMYTESTWG